MSSDRSAEDMASYMKVRTEEDKMLISMAEEDVMILMSKHKESFPWVSIRVFHKNMFKKKK